MEIEQADFDELRCGALTAIDGLWFMAAEEKLGFEGALELDVKVWRRYGVVMLKRACKLMGIELDEDNPPDLETVNQLLEVLCAIDGTECSSEVSSPDSGLFTVRRCSWWENLRKAGREADVPCELVDNSTFEAWLEAVDPGLEMEITHSLPRGDQCCTWIIRRRP
ncbi:MAG: DUF6125 family protein [Candidatus Geothermincolia bacterium]